MHRRQRILVRPNGARIVREPPRRRERQRHEADQEDEPTDGAGPGACSAARTRIVRRSRRQDTDDKWRRHDDEQTHRPDAESRTHRWWRLDDEQGYPHDRAARNSPPASNMGDGIGGAGPPARHGGFRSEHENDHGDGNRVVENSVTTRRRIRSHPDLPVGRDSYNGQRTDRDHQVLNGNRPLFDGRRRERERAHCPRQTSSAPANPPRDRAPRSSHRPNRCVHRAGGEH